jgi:hypothetical protein
MGIVWPDGYSADLEISLIIEGNRYRVAKLGPDYLILADAQEIRPGDSGKVVITVDGRSTAYEVVLFRGASAGRQEPVPFL